MTESLIPSFSLARKDFHNFSHAQHVVMSVSKLMSRIVAPSDMDFGDSIAKRETLHDHTYVRLRTTLLLQIEGLLPTLSVSNDIPPQGITSDPLTQFACVFSALIHDGMYF